MTEQKRFRWPWVAKSKAEAERRAAALATEARMERRFKGLQEQIELLVSGRGRLNQATESNLAVAAYQQSVTAFLKEPTIYTDVMVRALQVALLEPSAFTFERVADPDDTPEVKARKIEKAHRRKRRTKKDGAGETIQAVEVVTPKIERFLRRPTPDKLFSMTKLVMLTFMDMDFGGQGYWAPVFDEKKPAHDDEDGWRALLRAPPDWSRFTGQVERLSPLVIHPGRALDGVAATRTIPFFDLSGASQGFGQSQQAFAMHPDRVVYFFNPHPLSNRQGLGFVEIINSIPGDIRQMLDSYKQFLLNGGLSNIISTDQALTAQQRGDITVEYVTRASMTGAESVAVFDRGAKLEKGHIDPALDKIDGVIDKLEGAIHTASRVPPMERGDTSETHYNNAVFQHDIWRNSSIDPAAVMFWADCSAQLGPHFIPGDEFLFFVPETERARFLGETDEGIDLAQAQAVSFFLEGVAAGKTSPESAKQQLQVNYGYDADQAEKLIADHGTSFTATPASPFAFSAGASDKEADAPDPFRLIEVAAESLNGVREGYATRTGKRLAIAKQMIRGTGKLEQERVRETVSPIEEYLDRFMRAVLAKIRASKSLKSSTMHRIQRSIHTGGLILPSGLTTTELLYPWREIPKRKLEAQDVERLLAEVLDDFDGDLFRLLEGASLESLEAAGALGGSIAGAQGFELTAATRAAWIDQLQVRSQLMDQTTADLARRNMLRGIAAGDTLGDLAKRVEEAMERNNPARAVMIAQTEAGGAVQQGIQAGMRFAGVENKEWVATRDNKVRLAHQAPPKGPDGVVVPIDGTWTLTDPSGITVEMRFPRDLANGTPGLTINCRCSAAPSFE